MRAQINATAPRCPPALRSRDPLFPQEGFFGSGLQPRFQTRRPHRPGLIAFTCTRPESLFRHRLRERQHRRVHRPADRKMRARRAPSGPTMFTIARLACAGEATPPASSAPPKVLQREPVQKSSSLSVSKSPRFVAPRYSPARRPPESCHRRIHHRRRRLRQPQIDRHRQRVLPIVFAVACNSSRPARTTRHSSVQRQRKAMARPIPGSSRNDSSFKSSPIA